ncbi:hypothetical protein K505DRAFT_240148 [Melanomma pulvis-pyrius CBS 109.77]|uniref:Uncharacterized protein n=1 Tax=Melanomma pulvis-pyrius CBS 109.77 TaxID=1314802 RepID=A0A6A6XGN0_9PLEO|nr:hypothetical protein K505DRAFT_240148 [Melanomma pulvis-pyrius CBS 109.77]
MTLYTDAAAGLLTPKKLQAYGAGLKDDIDPTTGLTPLIAAINNAHIKVVELLLSSGADPDKPSRDHRTPLFWATWKRGASNRAEIVSALIAVKAEVDATSTEVQNITPLMNSVDKLRDPEVISLLVDAGASVTATNIRGKSAKALAENIGEPKLSKALRPKLERHAPTAETVNMLVSFVLFIFAWINNKVLDGIVQGVARQIFKLTGEYNPVMAGPKEPKSVEEFEDKINDWLVESNLGKFFQSDDGYLNTVAKKAMELKEDKSTFLSEPENLEKLVKLSLYKTIIYCDDSTSMGYPSSPSSRAHAQVELVKRMTRLCATIVPDDEGVDLFYIHSDGALNAREDKISEVMNKKKPSRGTPVGTKLKEKILEPFVYQVLKGADKKFQRPLLVTIITDGAPSNEQDNTFENAILECIKELRRLGYPEHAVVFQVSQIGHDTGAANFLKELEEKAKSVKSLYCTSGKSMGSNSSRVALTLRKTS